MHLILAEFSIWTREAGAGGLSIAVEGPSRAEISFEDRKDGSCGVSYVAQEPGVYSIISPWLWSGAKLRNLANGSPWLQVTTRCLWSSMTSTSPTAPTWCPCVRPRTMPGASLLPVFRWGTRKHRHTGACPQLSKNMGHISAVGGRISSRGFSKLTEQEEVRQNPGFNMWD